MSFQKHCPGCFQNKNGAAVCPHCGYDESQPRSTLFLPHGSILFDQYRVGKVLGRPGGFGITYLGWDVNLQQRVAIKEFLPREIAVRSGESPEVHAHTPEDKKGFDFGKEQFLREARIVAKLDHPNIVRVRNFFNANGTAYMVMDYYEGMSLGDYLGSVRQVIPPEIAIPLIKPILDGLQYVHERGVVHRDLKPHNIYLATIGRPILLDFGAARQAAGDRVQSMSVVLTEGYAPLEQYQRRTMQGPWTDVYGVAATLYRMVTGLTPPIALDRLGRDPIEEMQYPNVPPEVVPAMRQALSVRPHQRFQSAAEFKAALDIYRPAGTVAGTSPPASPVGAPGLAAAPAPMPIPGPGEVSVPAVPPLPPLPIADVSRPSPALPPKTDPGVARPVSPAGPLAGPTPPGPVAATPLATVPPDARAPVVATPTPSPGARPGAAAGEIPAAAVAGVAAASEFSLAARKMGDGPRPGLLQSLRTPGSEPTAADGVAATPTEVARAAQAGRTSMPTSARITLGLLFILILGAAVYLWVIDARRPNAESVTRVVAPPPGPTVTSGTSGDQGTGNALVDAASRPASSSTLPTMIAIPAGQIEMGAVDAGEPDVDPSRPRETVQIAPFKLSGAEVTQGQFSEFVRTTGYQNPIWRQYPCESPDGKPVEWTAPGYTQTPDMPVVCVSWTDAVAYTGWLTRQTGRPYRLPSEAEWEYAARAGTRTAWWWGADFNPGAAACAACTPRGRDRPFPVRTFTPNPFGLYDTAGNAREWTCSMFGRYGSGSAGVCGQPVEDSEVVVRGGSWQDGPEALRSGTRNALPPYRRNSWTGFRVLEEVRNEADVPQPAAEPVPTGSPTQTAPTDVIPPSNPGVPSPGAAG